MLNLGNKIFEGNLKSKESLKSNDLTNSQTPQTLEDRLASFDQFSYPYYQVESTADIDK
jgi:hypothetical protein